MLKVEYLVLYDRKKTTCKTTSALKSLLQTDADVSIHKNKITHQDYTADLTIKSRDGDDKPHISFTISISCEDTNNIDKFSNLLRSIKRSLALIDKNIYIIWDDVSLYYAREAYPLISNIENLMRKLITKFMLTNIGLDWTKERVPVDVESSINTKNNDINYLHNVDFIKLTTFLFSENFSRHKEDLIKHLKSTKDLESLDLSQIKTLLPESNWERYFSPFVNCESSYLENKWVRLYDYRCQVAHNKVFSRSDLEQVKQLTEELTPILQAAIDSLDDIFVSEEEKEIIVEDIIANQDITFSKFIDRYKKLSHVMLSIANKVDSRSLDSRSFRSIANLSGILREHEIISENQYRDIKLAVYLRNDLVHRDESISLEKIVMCQSLIEAVISDLENKLANIERS